MRQIFLFLFCSALLGLPFSKAQTRIPPGLENASRWTYDIGLSTGSYNSRNYSELNLGLNWIFSEYILWRNSAFSRFGSGIDSVLGLDSSARFTLSAKGDSGLGFNFFLGPGYRFSNKENSAVLGETGLTLRVAGISVGAGYKALYYDNPGTNPDGTSKSRTDSNIFLIFAGGGAF